MSKAYTPVTVEDYDNTMRATVNAFYEHAMNDSSISREEAIDQTGQVAESYLNTMDEVQAAHENGEILSVAETENSETNSITASDNVEEGTGVSDGAGIDGEAAEDGGIDEDGLE